VEPFVTQKRLQLSADWLVGEVRHRHALSVISRRKPIRAAAQSREGSGLPGRARQVTALGIRKEVAEQGLARRASVDFQKACMLKKGRRIRHHGAVAQLGERLNGIQEVVGSTPIGSTSSHCRCLLAVTRLARPLTPTTFS
jgi:hypothetical protein